MFKKLFFLYKEGLKNQSKLGRSLWILVIIKLFIMFFILKIFFFPNFLKSKFDNDKEKSEYVLNQLTK
jgi:hypothetical protein